MCIVNLTNQLSSSLNSSSNIWAYALVTCVHIMERKRVNFVPFIFERLKTSEVYFLPSLYLSSLSSLTLAPLQLSAVSNPDPASARLSFYFDSVCLRSRFAASGKVFRFKWNTTIYSGACGWNAEETGNGTNRSPVILSRRTRYLETKKTNLCLFSQKCKKKMDHCTKQGNNYSTRP